MTRDRHIGRLLDQKSDRLKWGRKRFGRTRWQAGSFAFNRVHANTRRHVRDRAVGQFVVVAVCKSVLAGGKGWHVGQSLKILVNNLICVNLTCLVRPLSTEAVIFSVKQAVSR
jgi:hypothetical protein